MRFPKVRFYEAKDAAFLPAVFFDSVRTVGLRDYSQAQVEAWAPVIPDPAAFQARARDSRVILVAVNEADEPRERRITRLFVEASEAARRLFLRRGFAEVKRRDFVLGGVSIHNHQMEKLLSHPHSGHDLQSRERSKIRTREVD